MTFPKKSYCSLEDPDIRLRAQEAPRDFRGNYSNGCLLDEIQKVPQLLSYIQTLVNKTSFIGFLYPYKSMRASLKKLPSYL